MTTFNIGSQNAGSIQNVGGDLVVHGGIHGTADVHLLELRDRLTDVGAELDRLTLPAAARAAAGEALADAEAEAAAANPRRKRIRDSLRRVTDALEDCGALATAGEGLARALAGAVSLVALLA